MAATVAVAVAVAVAATETAAATVAVAVAATETVAATVAVAAIVTVSVSPSLPAAPISRDAQGMGGITIAFREELVTVSTRDNLLAAVWRGPPSVEQLKRLRQVGITLAERHPQGTLFVNIMLTGNARFSSEARAEAAKQTAENAMGATAGAHVIAAEGLVAATVRAFISTVLMLSRPSRPTKVFANIKEAAPWLVAHAPPGELHWDEAKLVALYDELVAEA